MSHKKEQVENDFRDLMERGMHGRGEIMSIDIEIAPLSIVILSQTQINRLSAHYEHLGPALSGMMDWSSLDRDTGTWGGWAGPQTNLVINLELQLHQKSLLI